MQRNAEFWHWPSRGPAAPPHWAPRPRSGVCGVCPACRELQLLCLCEKPDSALRLRMEANTDLLFPRRGQPRGASAVPFGPVLPGRTGNKRTSWGRFLKVWGGQEPGWREVPSARSQWSGGWMDLRPVFACRSGGRAPGFSLSSVQFAWFSPSCLFSEVRGH